MKNELQYFKVGENYGGNQDTIKDKLLQFAGCASITACDSCVYFDLYHGTHLFENSKQNLSEEEYLHFAKNMMRHYIRPGMRGVDTLSRYIRGMEKYMLDHGGLQLVMEPLFGDEDLQKAKVALVRQIDAGYPVPMLMLRHHDQTIDDYEWHWFLLTGYEEKGTKLMTKVVSYGKAVWFEFDHLWNTGFDEKGGLIVWQPL